MGLPRISISYILQGTSGCDVTGKGGWYLHDWSAANLSVQRVLSPSVAVVPGHRSSWASSPRITAEYRKSGCVLACPLAVSQA